MKQLMTRDSFTARLIYLKAVSHLAAQVSAVLKNMCAHQH